jgi:hypothetical protein
MSADEQTPDAALVARQLRIAKWVVLVVILALSVFVFLYYRERSMHRAIRSRLAGRDLHCQTAKRSAIWRAQMAMDDEIRRREEGGSAPSHHSAGDGIYVYVWGCAPNPDDDETLDMAARVSQLVGGLFRARDFERLAAVLEQLQETPLERWKDLELPDAPSLFLQLSGGDEEEAKRMAEDFIRAATEKADGGQ